MNEKEIHIHEWAETRSFQDLNATEMSSVLEFMQADDYDALYRLNHQVSAELASDVKNHIPHVSSLDALKNRLQERSNPKPVIWRMKLPMYWTAAACLLVFLTSFFLFSGKEIPEAITYEKTIIQKVYDTLYVDRPVLTEVVKQVYVTVDHSPERPKLETSFVPVDAEFVKVVAPAPSAEGVAKSFGNSAVNADMLEQFKVQM